MTTMTARCADDLLAAVPVVLGFQPADSIVMLTVDARHAFHARVDLPPDRRGLPEVVELLLEPAVRHRATAVVLMIYTADDDLARAVVRRVRRGRPGGRTPDLAEALRVEDDRWFPLLRDRQGLGATGVPYDVSSHPFVVEAVVAGRVLHGSRADLAATLVPDPEGVAAVEAARGGPRRTAGWVGARLREWVGRGDPPPADVAAGLLEALARPEVRDATWTGVLRDTAGDHVRFWSALVRRAPDDLAAHAAAVVAVCSWVAGDGALAWCAVDRARALDPRHPLAVLVAELLVAAVPPSDWDDVRPGIGSAR